MPHTAGPSLLRAAVPRVCGQTEVRPGAGNGQEGIEMSDGKTQSDWSWGGGVKKKEEGNRQTEREDLLGFHFNSTGSFFSLYAKPRPGH